ncbi:HD domain protein [Sulfurospirillum diekertiae]|uniref:HD domain protein n=1 Tax=Sulfurospirillum diekertiae TaxID=1854492 RepID=A0A290HRN1_9BACT|nr:HD domain-containing phosphohydrolase [Sulfurospirillum diekertiae]ATB70358.1 HD domain protein [Sulfurospirillum diekertiae]
MYHQLNLREVTYVLTEALDYVGINDIHHGKRVAYIAHEIGKNLGLRQSKLDKIMLMAMLHDCGVSLTDVHNSIVNNLDWEDSQIHSERGAKLLQSVPIYSEFSDIIALHHTHWEHFLPQIDSDIKLYANLIYLSDRIDALRSQFGAHLSQEKEYIRSIIRTYTPELFAPKLCEAFIELSHTDFFWHYLESDPLHYYFKEWVEKGKIETVHFSLLKSIASMFANIVDAKDHSNQHHTLMVASLARTIAGLCHLSIGEQDEIELAALFQNLGKLRIPDAILKKSTSLSDDEQIKIRRQGFDTQVILRQIKGFDYITKIISSYYKEMMSTLQGKTYQTKQNTLIPLETSILMIANTFLTQLHNATKESITPAEIETLLDTLITQSHQLEIPMKEEIALYLKCYCEKGIAPIVYM